MSPSRRKKKGFFKKNIKAIVVVLLIAAAATYYVLEADQHEAAERKAHEVVSPYSMLENKDSTDVIANVSLNYNVSILQISRDFYKSEIFWPYIFQANERLTEEDNILNLNKGMILSIPRISSSLLDTSNVSNVQYVKYLSDSLMSDINSKREAALATENLSDW